MTKAMSHEYDIIMKFVARWGVETARASSIKVIYTKVRQFLGNENSNFDGINRWDQQTTK